MLQCLTYRELGLHPSHYLERIEKSRRSGTICLSQKGELEQGHSCGINSVDIDPVEGRYLLSCGSNAKILIHDTAMVYYKEKFKCDTVAKVEGGTKSNHKNSIETIQWYSEDTGMFLTSSSDRTLKVWDTNALQVVESFGFEGIVYHHQIGKSSKKHCLVAVGCEDSRVYLCDLKTGSATHILRGHNSAVLSVAWSPTNQFLLATGSCDNKVLFWDIRKAAGSLFTLDQYNGKGGSSTLNTKTAHNGHVNSLAFTSSGLFLMTYGTDHRLRLWDTYSGKNTLVNYGRVSNPSRKSIQCAITDGVSSDLVYVPSSTSIKIFDVHSGKTVSSLIGHYSNVTCCTFQQHYQVLFSGSSDCHLLSWLPDMKRDKLTTEEEVLVHDDKREKNPFQDTWSSDED